MTVIIGISGKKQSGKSDLCNYLTQFAFSTYGLLDVNFFSFASSFKDKICIDILGLSYEQCYGTDEQKNELTKYKWENFPDFISFNYPNRKKYMTAREILQVLGTEIFRNFFDRNVWVDATFREIKKKSPKVAIIPDVRFPGEVERIIKENGYIIRLTRNILNDSHESETILDKYFFSGERCYIINNQNMTLFEQRKEAEEIFVGILKKNKLINKYPKSNSEIDKMLDNIKAEPFPQEKIDRMLKKIKDKIDKRK